MSDRPIITLRGPVRRHEGGEWEWTGIWAFGALPDEHEEPDETYSPKYGKKKGKKKLNLKGARPFRYHVRFILMSYSQF